MRQAGRRPASRQLESRALPAAAAAHEWEPPAAVRALRAACLPKLGISALVHTRWLGNPCRIVPEPQAGELAQLRALSSRASPEAKARAQAVRAGPEGFAIFLGSRTAATDPDLLKDLGISVVLSLVADHDEAALRGSVACAPSVDLHRVWCVADAPEERHRMLAVWREVVVAVSKARRERRRVLVHCVAGMSRSASAVVAWIVAPQAEGGLGVGLGAALRWVRATRPIASPNDGFLTGLAVWAAAARRGEVCLATEVGDAEAAAEAAAALEVDAAAGSAAPTPDGETLRCSVNKGEPSEGGH